MKDSHGIMTQNTASSASEVLHGLFNQGEQTILCPTGEHG